MGAKKRSAPANRKRNRSATTEEDNNLQSTTNRSAGSRSNSNKSRASPNAHKQLWYGGSILVVAIGLGWAWNNFLDPIDPRMAQFWSLICRRNAAKCARFVVPARRTLQAGRPIRAGEVLAEIPRELQVWDLDALRDERIREDFGLLEARHDRTNNPLSRGAFLAAYLALESAVPNPEEIADTTTDSQSESAGSKKNSMNPIRRSYLDVMPTIDELAVHHPILWDPEELRDMLGSHSLTMGVVSAYRDMIASEYAAFSKKSPDFAGMINETQYKVARLRVLTRSFSPGPVGPEEIEEEEAAMYMDKLGIDFRRGCHAMVPILDMLNHHPNPNVVYTYNKDKRVFVITSKTTIPASFEVYDSYGKYTDSHLFAKFGFVNGDGSGHIATSISVFHHMLDFELGDEFSYLPLSGTLASLKFQQLEELKRYLQFDDGYENCIPGVDEADPNQWKLKELKLQHLLRIANDSKHWVIHIPPRNPNSRPAESSEQSITEIPPNIDPRKLRMNFEPLIQTCRLITLINSDYDDGAIGVLQENLGNPDFVVTKGNDALEYRAFMWYVCYLASAVQGF